MRVDRDPVGRVTSVASGTVNGVTDTDWANLSVLQTATSIYDPVTRLKAQDILTAGGATRRLVQYGYDADGRLKCTVARIGLAAASDPCQQLGSAATGYDQVSETTYGGDGRADKTREGGADTTTTTYTPNGQLKSVIDGAGNRTEYDYDGFDRVAKIRYPKPAKGAGESSATDFEEFEYDANDNLARRRTRDGTWITYTVDALNRQTNDENPNTSVADTDVTYTYDNLGRLTQAGDQNGWYGAFEYDALGRVTRQYSNLSSNTLAYDAGGRLTRQTWADGFFVRYEYLLTGEVSTVREQDGIALAAFQYDDLGRRTLLTRGNGTRTEYGYDPGLQWSTITQNVFGISADLTVRLNLDNLGRIASREASNDLYTHTASTDISRAYTANGLNQYTQAGTVTPTYDARGNVTSAGGQSYTYNTRNELFGSGAGNLFYRNPLGLMNQMTVSGVTTNIDHVGPNVATEFSGSGAVARRYVYGPGVDEPLVWYEGAATGDQRYLHADERGSVVTVTNNAGAAIAINTYDEYGRPGPNNLGRFQYTGQRWLPELGLYDYKARMYSPTLGRFMQTDPIGYADGMNWYNYTGGDPVNRSDPSGLQAEIVVTGVLPKPNNDKSPGYGGGGSGFGAIEPNRCDGGFYADDTLVVCANLGGGAGPAKSRQNVGTTPKINLPQIVESVEDLTKDVLVVARAATLRAQSVKGSGKHVWNVQPIASRHSLWYELKLLLGGVEKDRGNGVWTLQITPNSTVTWRDSTKGGGPTIEFDSPYINSAGYVKFRFSY